ncbi:hypothetical protein A2533_02470 [Candidatus Falkowbacteria bacterium RIFOXYD2_FULL_35_9]|uniref:Uncharacterized protein n=1 Tax=Candidatus Falkowbacteria bacterium RIFOXYC2_FULL_36_12 TaxID=1798002 RepID=A0A1F5T3J9_9BACT|nr:MAG: hypothetical protein A2300_02030 [Candidatus Falkowbacteria bacterium RIFOXYB2_FULL_35_7]OGF33489.1 MAG: hypothetical protein A2478_02240 [Candidatus Falkowbacteria bacterium RIFOXYC2_FULL_36_12]OGF46841.1 MAG: hypothetical protein A2533_02470 [Candidatus Falkowbacteria bacterium RIFOXYD2_FULL_35_9]
MKKAESSYLVRVGSFYYRVFYQGAGIYSVVDVRGDCCQSNRGEAPEDFVARCLAQGDFIAPER